MPGVTCGGWEGRQGLCMHKGLLKCKEKYHNYINQLKNVRQSVVGQCIRFGVCGGGEGRVRFCVWGWMMG